MNSTIDTLVKCPFWLYTTKNFIACEGHVKNTCMLTKFPTNEAKKRHIDCYCVLENGGKCPMAKNLYRKYEEEE